MAKPETILILTGAGISAESGLGTFRDEGGIWTRYDLDEVATPEGFARNPDLVHEFYNARRAHGSSALPNPAHHALARLAREHPGHVTIVTQNIDDLHEQAGSIRVVHMHGELARMLCNGCGGRADSPAELSTTLVCPACGVAGGLRPDVVWFGEVPYHMDRIMGLLATTGLFISIGTSGSVYPAAGFVRIARDAGARTLELNLEPSDGAREFEHAHHGPASMIVPAFVERYLASGAIDRA